MGTETRPGERAEWWSVGHTDLEKLNAHTSLDVSQFAGTTTRLRDRSVSETAAGPQLAG
jgi:hypothetical protein